MWERRPDRAHVAHHVELPVHVPLGILDLLEARLPRDADVVDEDVEPSEQRCRLAHNPFGSPGEERSART